MLKADSNESAFVIDTHFYTVEVSWIQSFFTWWDPLFYNVKEWNAQ